MQTTNRLFDDLARVANGAMSAFSGVRQEIETLVQARVERLLADRGLVSREEFEAVRAMAIRAREENERLAKRLDALENAVPAQKPASPKARTAVKTTKKVPARARKTASNDDPKPQ